MISGLSMIYNQILSAGFGVFLAAFLGAEAYGTVNLARNIFVNAVFLSPLGLDLALQRHLGQSTSDVAAAAEVAWLRLVTFSLSGLIVLCLFLGGGSALEAHVFQHVGFGAVLAFTMLALPFNTDLAVLGGAYRGRYRPIPSLIATYLIQPTMRVAAIILLSFAMSGLWAAVYGTLISFVVAWLYIAYAAHRDFSAPLAAIRSATAASMKVLAYAPIMGMSSFVYTMARTLDTMSLGAFGALADVGRYAVVLMMCQLVGTIGSALGQTLGTSVATAASANDKPRIVTMLYQNMDLGSILSAPFCVAIAVWGSDVDLLLGRSYHVAPLVFVLAAITQWLFTVTHYCSVALSMTGRHTTELYNNIAALVIEAIGCLILVPRFGIAGAAAATLFMLLSLNVIRQIQIGRLLGDNLIRLRLLTPLIVSSLLAIPLAWLGSVAGFRAWWLTGILASVYIVISFAVLLGFLTTREQKERLLGLLRRRPA